MNTATASVCAFPRKALWLSVRIAKLVRGDSHQRVAPQGLTFGMLEPCEGKLSRTVLRGERGREAPDLPGQQRRILHEAKDQHDYTGRQGSGRVGSLL